MNVLSNTPSNPKEAPQPATPEDVWNSLSGWKPLGPDWELSKEQTSLDVLYELTDRSLKEVKALTEHEDNKAQRILTAMAFLAAVSGGIFALSVRSLIESKVVESYLDFTLTINWLAVCVYVGFGLYLFVLSIGVSIVLYAIMPRFKIPQDWNTVQRSDAPRSYLFAMEILKVPEEKWAKAYIDSNVAALKLEYVKNSILETYLVAQKVAIKLRWLKRGVKILFASTILLAFWLPIAILCIGVPAIRI